MTRTGRVRAPQDDFKTPQDDFKTPQDDFKE